MKKLIYLFLLALLFSCNNSKQEECKSPLPQAIFSKDLATITSHEFTMKDRMATEEVSFQNGIVLSVFQGGCHEIKQEFVFKIPNNLLNSEKHTEQAINQLEFIAGLDISLSPFSQWAEAIKANEVSFFESQEVEVASNIFIDIDRIPGKDSQRLILKFRGS